jgi:hypothetical protein
MNVQTSYFVSANFSELDVHLGLLIHANFAKKRFIGFWLMKNIAPLILVLLQPLPVLSPIVISRIPI